MGSGFHPSWEGELISLKSGVDMTVNANKGVKCFFGLLKSILGKLCIFMTLLVKLFLHMNYALNFWILKILPIFRDIYQNRFLKKHKNEIFRKLNDGILMLYLGQNAYYMNRKYKGHLPSLWGHLPICQVLNIDPWDMASNFCFLV